MRIERARLRRREAEQDTDFHQVDHIRDTELTQQLDFVPVYRLLADGKLRADLLRAMPGEQQIEYFALALRQHRYAKAFRLCVMNLVSRPATTETGVALHIAELLPFGWPASAERATASVVPQKRKSYPIRRLSMRSRKGLHERLQALTHGS